MLLYGATCFESFLFSHHLSPLLCRAGLPQGEDIAADWDLPPDAGFGVLGEAVSRVHHKHAIGGQPVHLTIRRLPLSSLLLRKAKTWEGVNRMFQDNTDVHYAVLNIKHLEHLYQVFVTQLSNIQKLYCNSYTVLLFTLGLGLHSQHSAPNIWAFCCTYLFFCHISLWFFSVLFFHLPAFYSLTLAYTCLKHQTKHSSPLGRCSWRSRSPRRRCVQCKAAFAGTWCGRQSGRWCSGPSGCLRYSGFPPLCPSPQSLWDSLSIDRSGEERWKCFRQEIKIGQQCIPAVR